jgi:hypothetical protein
MHEYATKVNMILRNASRYEFTDMRMSASAKQFEYLWSAYVNLSNIFCSVNVFLKQNNMQIETREILQTETPIGLMGGEGAYKCHPSLRINVSFNTVTCIVVRVTKMSGSSSDYWIY